MFYRKNVPNWERVLRFIMGIAALAGVFAFWGVSNLGVGLALLSAMFAMTGLVGFCPMCALLGRKIDKGH